MIGVVILAAGESRRMGYPKALLRYRGQTFLESVVQAARAAALDPVVVVLGPDGDKILSQIVLRDVIVARNPVTDTGQIGSLRQGIQALLNRPVDACAVWPVDQPHVRVATVQLLVQQFREGRHQIVVPAHQGRRGHPAIFSAAVFEELLHAPDQLGARAVVRADPARVAQVEVEDPAIADDIDTPAAYESLIRQSGPAGDPPPEGLS